MSVDLNAYRVFRSVAQNGSLTSAARELYVTQSAVSQSIKQLEEQLGGRLFVRTPRGMVLTPEGGAIYEFIDRATSLLFEAENKFRQMKNLMTGQIRVGASDSLCKYYLLSHIKRFHNAYPELHIQVTNRTSSETLNLLRTGKVDIGFVNMPYDGSEFVFTECMEVHDCFVGDLQYRTGRVYTLEEIAGLPLIMLEGASNSRRAVDSFFEEQNIKLAPDIELGSLDLVADFAKIGMGVACVTREFVKERLDEGTLTELALEAPLPPRAIAIARLSGVPLPFAAEQFMRDILGGGDEPGSP